MAKRYKVLGADFCTYCGTYNKVVIEYEEDPGSYLTHCEKCGQFSSIPIKNATPQNLRPFKKYQFVELT